MVRQTRDNSLRSGRRSVQISRINYSSAKAKDMIFNRPLHLTLKLAKTVKPLKTVLF